MRHPLSSCPKQSIAHPYTFRIKFRDISIENNPIYIAMNSSIQVQLVSPGRVVARYSTSVPQDILSDGPFQLAPPRKHYWPMFLLYKVFL